MPGGNGTTAQSGQRRVIVCAGTGCVASGAYKVFQAFAEQIAGGGHAGHHRVPAGEASGTTCA